jgi:hypothetical protein
VGIGEKSCLLVGGVGVIEQFTPPALPCVDRGVFTGALMTQSMDDVALLRQTIRRCTALVVGALAITGVSLQRGEVAALLVVIAIGAVLFLLVDFVVVTPDSDRSGDD